MKGSFTEDYFMDDMIEKMTRTTFKRDCVSLNFFHAENTNKVSRSSTDIVTRLHFLILGAYFLSN